MSEVFLAAHKAKHVLSHVLAAAGSKRWPGVHVGQTGETSTGFFADFALPGPPDEADLPALTDGMAGLLNSARTFRSFAMGPAEALDLFGGQPWKRHQAEVIAELEGRIEGFELEGYFDMCDCILKDTRELRAIHPEKFLITHWQPVIWSHRGRDEVFTRVSGELFPAPPPCTCCQG